MSHDLMASLRSRVLLCDGAMGTQLQGAGLEIGGCGEAWNLDHPERVVAIHRDYVEAGVDCLVSNSFGASRINLARRGPDLDVAQVNREAVRLARAAFGERPGFVLGDVGPFGGLMEPYGDVSRDQVLEAFGEQSTALLEAGADAILIETQTALDELGAAIEAARRAGAGVVIASVAFDLSGPNREIRTMMGTTPEEVAAFVVDEGADVLGLNCGSGIDVRQATQVVQRYRRCCELPVMVQPNAGQPVLENGQVVYRQTPDEMAEDAGELLRAGPRVIGGCCGTTPQHIRRLREVLDAMVPGSAS